MGQVQALGQGLASSCVQALELILGDAVEALESQDGLGDVGVHGRAGQSTLHLDPCTHELVRCLGSADGQGDGQLLVGEHVPGLEVAEAVVPLLGLGVLAQVHGERLVLMRVAVTSLERGQACEYFLVDQVEPVGGIGQDAVVEVASAADCDSEGVQGAADGGAVAVADAVLDEVVHIVGHAMPNLGAAQALDDGLGDHLTGDTSHDGSIDPAVVPRAEARVQLVDEPLAPLGREQGQELCGLDEALEEPVR